MKTTSLLFRILCAGCLLYLPAAPVLAQKADTARYKADWSLHLPSDRRCAFSLGAVAHTRSLQGFSLNLLTTHTAAGAEGVQLSGLTNATRGGLRGVHLAGAANLCELRAYGVLAGGFMNIVGETASGVQLSALANIARKMRGASISGLTNLSGNDARGLQLSALANISGKDQHGAAVCGLMNVSGNRLSGVQLSGIINLNGQSAHGLQLTGLSNIAVNLKGAQIAGAMNVCQGRMHGLQLSATNYAHEVDGLQLGILNLCDGSVRGCQVGLINHSKDTTAHKVGLVNVTPQTRIQLMMFGGNACKLNFGVRFKNRFTYTMLGFGTHYSDMSRKFSGALFYRAGLLYALSPRWEISGDLGFFHIESFRDKQDNRPERLYSFQGRVNLDFTINRFVGVMASAGYGTARYYHRNQNYERKPIFELGIHLF